MNDYNVIPLAYDGPTTIYLQYHERVGDGIRTWCEDQINDNDIEFVTAARLREEQRQVKRLLGVLEELESAAAVVLDLHFDYDDSEAQPEEINLLRNLVMEV